MLGLSGSDIVRSASEGRLRIFHRFSGATGYLVVIDSLERDDPELGTRLVPSPTRMPDSAIAHFASGVYAVPGESVAAVADSLLVSGEADVVMFAAPGGDRSQGFVPDDSVTMTLANVEVSTNDLQRLRQTIAVNIEPERVAAARAAQKATTGALASAAGKRAHRLVSEALDAYATNSLPQKITSPNEIEQVRSGIALLIEFEGARPGCRRPAK